MPTTSTPSITSRSAQNEQRGFDRNALRSLSPEHQDLFERFGRGVNQKPDHLLIHRAIESWARSQPEAIAVEHLGQSISYGTLDARAEQLADILVADGVRPGDTVAVFLRRSISMVVGFLATLKVGAAYVPQHVGVAPDSQLRHILAETGASVVLTLADLAADVPCPDGGRVIAIDDLATDHDGVGTDDRRTRFGDQSPDDTGFVLFTSGTTGSPNGVQVTHRNVCNVLATDPGRLGMAPGKKVAQILSIAFDMAEWETLGALMNGATLLIRGSDIQATAERADIVIATPSILGSIDASRCHNVETVAVAGEPCPKPLADIWGAFCNFYNSCGPTETTIINTALHYRPGLTDLTIGEPTPNNTVYILDEHRRPCPIGDIGEMWAGGDCVSSGYLNNPKLTGERYAPDPFLGGGRMMFRTRDLGRWTEGGELEHHGRTDDQVKIRGFRVELDSISAALETVAGCTAAVTLKLDSRTLVAFVQGDGIDPETARRVVEQRLPYYCVPESVTVMRSLPRTSRGKVDKRLLLSSLTASRSTGPDTAAVAS